MSQEEFDRWSDLHGVARRWMADANEDDLEAARRWLAEEKV